MCSTSFSEVLECRGMLDISETDLFLINSARQYETFSREREREGADRNQEMLENNRPPSDSCHQTWHFHLELMVKIIVFRSFWHPPTLQNLWNDVENTPERYSKNFEILVFRSKFVFSSLFSDLDLPPPLGLGPDLGFWGKSITNRIVLGAP